MNLETYLARYQNTIKSKHYCIGVNPWPYRHLYHMCASSSQWAFLNDALDYIIGIV